MNEPTHRRCWTWPRVRRWASWAVLVGVVAAIVWVAFRERPVLVDVAVARRGPLEVTVDEDGVTRIRERYVVSTPLQGRMSRIDHEVGDTVRAEETTLVRMEPTDAELLDPRAVAQAQARVRAAERRLEQAKTELERIELLVNFAEREMGRLRKLRESNAASEKEFLEQELEFRAQQENARAASFAVDIAEYELELEKAALLLTRAEMPEVAGDEETPDMVLEIPAPITGRILRLYEESSGVIPAGAPLMELGDPSDLEVVVDVLSRDAVRIDPGDPVRLEQWGGGEPLEGRVRLVEPSGFTKVSALGVEEQRVNVIVDLLAPPERWASLGDNFRVDSRIVIWETDDTLQVPTSALFRVDGRWHLFAVRQGRARLVPVEVGQDNGVRAQIVAGIEQGETVIVYPNEAVADGVLVAPR